MQIMMTTDGSGVTNMKIMKNYTQPDINNVMQFTIENQFNQRTVFLTKK